MRSCNTLVHIQTMGKHKLTRLSTAQTWGEGTTFPLTVYSVHGHETNTQMSFCPETYEFRNSYNWDSYNFGGGHNFVCRPPIEMRYKAKL
jgi:hypothetical protein